MLFLCLLILVGCLLLFALLVARHSVSEKYSQSLNITPEDLRCLIDQDKAKDGLNYFKTKKLVICGLVRNSERTIDLVRRQLEAVGELFADYRCYIVENDSTDRTRDWLLEVVNLNPKVKILGCGINSPTCFMNLNATIEHDRSMSRIKKMVLLRNIYLQHLTQESEVKNFDFVLIWDFDIRGEFYLDGVGLNGWYFKNGIQGATANAICSNAVIHVNHSAADPVASGKYYDPYAHKDINQTRTFTTVNDVEPPSCAGAPIQLSSCFNGLTFYRKSSLTGLSYDTQAVGTEAICEHVDLHSKMTGIYLNPQFLYIIDQEIE